MEYMRELSDIEMESIRNRVSKIVETYDILNKTLKPDVFFGRLHFLFDTLLFLQRYEDYGIFTENSPTKRLRDIQDGLESRIDKFVDRYMDYAYRTASSMKTDKGRADKYFDLANKLISAFDCADTFWSGSKGFPHYRGPLFTERNYGRVESIYNKICDGEIGWTIIYYVNGYVSRTFPEMESEKHIDIDTLRSTKMIFSDGVCYDLTDANSIYSIAIPQYPPKSNDSPIYIDQIIEYLLRLKAEEYMFSDKVLALAFVRKSVELMKQSNCDWSRQDYQHMCWRLDELGQSDEATALGKWYKATIPTDEDEIDLILSGKIKKELSYVQKEIILVKSLTTDDMLQFSEIPYRLNCPIKKFIKDGGHPFAYMDLTPENIAIAKKELEKVNNILRWKSALFKTGKTPQIPIESVKFYEYSESCGYTRIMCHPYTFTRKIAKYPLSLFFCTRLDNSNFSTHGEIFYGKNGEILKGKICFATRDEIQIVPLRLVDGNLTALF